MDYEPSEPQNAMARVPQVIESESATTDHEHNHTGAAPVVISLVIVCVLALLAFSVTSCVAAFSESQWRSQYTNPNSFYEWDLEDDSLDDLWPYDSYY